MMDMDTMVEVLFTHSMIASYLENTCTAWECSRTLTRRDNLTSHICIRGLGEGISAISQPRCSSLVPQGKIWKGKEYWQLRFHYPHSKRICFWRFFMNWFLWATMITKSVFWDFSSCLPGWQTFPTLLIFLTIQSLLIFCQFLGLSKSGRLRSAYVFSTL